MNELAQAMISGITSFAATNIDDIVVLMLLFSTVNQSFRPQHIVAGQYLGFACLIAASLPGFLGGLIIAREWLGLLGFVPIAIGVHHLLHAEADPSIQTISHQLATKQSSSSVGSALAHLLTPQTYKVAGITIANGGDNIAIYVPLFANSSFVQLGILLATFFSLIAVWCGIAYYLTCHPAIARNLTRYGHRVVPFVLIGLGLFMLLESQSYKLLSLV